MNTISQTQSRLLTLENEMRDVENHLNHVTGNMVIMGRRNLNMVMDRIRTKLRLDDQNQVDGNDERLSGNERQRLERIVNGYHGQLVDSLELTKPVYVAAEVLIKNRLFYHIVDDERVAVEILDELRKQKLTGSFRFLVISRLVVKEVTDFDWKKKSL